MEDPEVYRQSLRRKLQFSESASLNLPTDDDLTEFSQTYVNSEAQPLSQIVNGSFSFKEKHASGSSQYEETDAPDDIFLDEDLALELQTAYFEQERK